MSHEAINDGSARAVMLDFPHWTMAMQLLPCMVSEGEVIRLSIRAVVQRAIEEAYERRGLNVTAQKPEVFNE